MSRALAKRLEALSHALDRLAERVVLFRCGNLVFVSFGLFAALGAAVAMAWTAFMLIGQGLDPTRFAALAVSGSVAVVLGSWLAGLVFDYRLVLEAPGEVLRRPVFVSWGGVLGLLLVVPAFAATTGFSALLILDALSRSVLLGHAVGRLGCLTYGCCFGHATDGRLAITYRHPESKAVRVGGLHGVRIHPAPLYEAGLDLVIVAIVSAAVMLGSPVGVPTTLAILLYGLGRFGVEFVRDNHDRMLAGPFSLNHAISLGFAGAGGLLLRPAALAAISPPSLSWSAALGALPSLLPVLVPATLVIFVGFSAQRPRVGAC